MSLLTNIKGLKLIYFTRFCNILMWKWSCFNSYADKIKQNMHFCLFCCYLVNIDNCCNDSFKWKKLVKWILAGWQFKKKRRRQACFMFLKHLSLNRYVVFLLKCCQMVIISDNTCMCVFLWIIAKIALQIQSQPKMGNPAIFLHNHRPPCIIFINFWILPGIKLWALGWRCYQCSMEGNRVAWRRFRMERASWS